MNDQKKRNEVHYLKPMIEKYCILFALIGFQEQRTSKYEISDEDMIILFPMVNKQLKQVIYQECS